MLHLWAIDLLKKQNRSTKGSNNTQYQRANLLSKLGALAVLRGLSWGGI